MLLNSTSRLLTHCFCVIALSLSVQSAVFAESEPGYIPLETNKVARIYRNPEERREAGLGTQITDWLKFSGLVEAESVYQHWNLSHHSSVSRVETPSVALQFGFEFTFTEWLGAELIVDAEYDGHRVFVDIDEGFVSAETEHWGLKVGRQYMNFGEYYSHFISGPMLEFGETRGDAIIIDNSPNDNLEFSAFLFGSDVGSVNGNPDIDWGVSIEYVSIDESVRLGASYLSDLAESEEHLLDGADYRRRVSAWSAYALVGFEGYEFTAEVVQAIDAFAELDNDSDKPFAYNLELAYFPTNTTQLAMRFEYSDELSDEPKWQTGVAATWRPDNNVTLSLEYLYGRYQNNFAFDDNDHELNDRHLIGLQMALEF